MKAVMVSSRTTRSVSLLLSRRPPLSNTCRSPSEYTRYSKITQHSSMGTRWDNRMVKILRVKRTVTTCVLMPVLNRSMLVMMVWKGSDPTADCPTIAVPTTAVSTSLVSSELCGSDRDRLMADSDPLSDIRSSISAL